MTENIKKFPKRVVVCNLCGNVGKTTWSVHGLLPRMKGAEFIAVESVNTDASDLGVEDVDKIKGAKFKEIFNRLLLCEDGAIIDVGSSNVEDFMAHLDRFEGAHEEIDYFIIPVIPENKAMKEGINTLRVLNALGVPKERIRILFNDVDDGVDEEFGLVLKNVKDMAIINKNAAIESNELFDMLSQYKITIDTLLNDPTDYRSKISEAKTGSKAELKRLTDMHMMKCSAKAVSRKLDVVFTEIFS